ncbi:hypothetical protein [Providencia huaxiensis]|uniref:hypothetical protein n=1 Tax=Providencia huaxiensis TaxID=2027290 RepID=UPI0034DCC991
MLKRIIGSRLTPKNRIEEIAAELAGKQGVRNMSICRSQGMVRYLATSSRTSSERGDSMMRSETKTIYGVDVLGMIAMFKQLRKWRTIRKLRNKMESIPS